MNVNTFTIIVLSYNSSSSIKETLDSIANQSKTDFTLIISDDCSTDDTIEIVRCWKANNETIDCLILESSENTGVTGNCNRALQQVRNGYVKLFAADDIMMPDFFEIMSKEAMINPKSIVQCRVELFGNNSNEYVSTYVDESYEALRIGLTYEQLIKKDYLVSPAVGFLPISFFIEYGYLDERFPMMEDYPLYLRLSEAGFQFCLYEKELIKYNIHDGSITNSGSKLYWQSLVKFYFYYQLPRLVKLGYWIFIIKTTARYLYYYVRYCR